MTAAVARGLLQVRLLLSTLTPYSRGLELQDALAEAVARRATPDQLLLVQVHDQCGNGESMLAKVLRQGFTCWSPT